MNIRNLLLNEITQEDLLNYYNANIIYEDLPDNVKGFIWMYKDINTIYINSKLSYYLRKKTLLHELAHIELNQLYRSKDLFNVNEQDYEKEVDMYIKNIKKEIYI